MFMPQLEIAITSLEDALLAVEGGADSLEVLRDLPNGGLTPPVDLVRSILARVTVPINVIVRPHASFHYSDVEFGEILRDAGVFAQMGVASIVFGAVTADNHLDVAMIRQIAEAISPTPVTVHRALDVSTDPESALRSLIGVVPRVLTSGPAPNAWEGRESTRQWVEQYGQHFQFVLSGGIRLEELAELYAITSAPAYHIGGAARTGNRVDVENVKRLREALR
jgi:copper homeostasis protein